MTVVLKAAWPALASEIDIVPAATSVCGLEIFGYGLSRGRTDDGG